MNQLTTPPTHEQLKAAYTKLTHLISNIEWDNCYDFMYTAALEKLPPEPFKRGETVVYKGEAEGEFEVLVTDGSAGNSEEFPGTVINSGKSSYAIGHHFKAWATVAFTRKSTI